MSKHTPGPIGGPPSTISEADQRLIFTALELLAASERLLDGLSRLDPSRPDDAWRGLVAELQAAVDKARKVRG